MFIFAIWIIPITTFAQEGWVTENNDKYYYENNEKVVGKKTIDGKTYYFNDEGIMQTGFIEIENVLYFFSRANGALKTGWQATTDERWYQREDGSVVIGKETIDGKTYYFNDKGIMQTGFITDEGILYFYSRANGALKTGWQATTDERWYQREDGSVVIGKETIDGKTYYFNDKGIMQTGFFKIDGKWYFFSRANGALKTGWQEAAEGRWYQQEDGSLITGKQTIDGKTYYFEENGLMGKGFYKIEDKWYFFSRVNGVLKTGWQESNDQIWYQQEDGTLITGVQTIDGREYSFNEGTGLLDGFKTVNGKKYYYDPDGTQAKGIQYIARRFYQFNSITGAFEKNVKQIRVIDISSHNGNIDWNKVKASGQVDAVILRLGYGIGYMDTKFIQNKNELERLGIPYSVYLFSYAENGNEALRESNFVVNTIQDYNVHIASNIFGIYYDLEDWVIKSTGENSYGISKDTYRNMITTFVNNTEKKLCIKVRVYASKNYIETRFPSDVQGYATWVAQWNDTLTYQGPYEGWQYTSSGNVPGISGNVDMSYFYM